MWRLKWQRQELREVCPKSWRIKGKSLFTPKSLVRQKAVSFSLSILRARKSNAVSCIILSLLPRRCFVAMGD